MVDFTTMYCAETVGYMISLLYGSTVGRQWLLLTRRVEVNDGPLVDPDGACAPVPQDLDPVPGRVVQAQVGRAPADAAGAQVRVQVQVAVHKLKPEKVALKTEEGRICDWKATLCKKTCVSNWAGLIQ